MAGASPVREAGGSAGLPADEGAGVDRGRGRWRIWGGARRGEGEETADFFFDGVKWWWFDSSASRACLCACFVFCVSVSSRWWGGAWCVRQGRAVTWIGRQFLSSPRGATPPTGEPMRPRLLPYLFLLFTHMEMR